MTSANLDRRSLLRRTLAAAGGAVLATPTGYALLSPTPAEAATGEEKRIAFRNVHNGERVDARWYGANGIDQAGLAEIDHGLRDWRTGEVKAIDPALIALLTSVREKLDVSPRTGFDLISGYRSPHTNEALREAGGARTGVAVKSQHMLGKATDVALPGIALDRLHAAAMTAKRGGVGFYPKDGFVHIDTGRVRHW